MAISFTIGGTNKTSKVLDSAFSLDMSIGSDWTCTFQVYDKDSTSSAYRPALDASVVVALGATNIFKGKIVGVRDEAIVPPATGTLTTVTARSSTIITQQVTVNKTYAAGMTLKAIVTDLVSTYLTGYGVTLDTGMATGPTLEAQTFDRVSMQATLNHLTDVTGWPWRLMPTDVLEMFSAGTKTTSYSLTNSNGKQIGGVTWEQTRTKFANRVYVRAGTESQIDVTDTYTGNGSTSLYALTYPFVTSRGYVTVAGVYETFGTGATWDYASASNSIQRTSNVPNGNAISITYTAQFPITVSAEDTADITAHGLWEEIIDAPDVFVKASAQELATGLLRNRKQSPKQVYLRTVAGAAYPGDTITATFANRTVTGDHLITQVRASGRGDQQIEWALTCLAGGEAQRDWTEMLRAALGGTASGSSGGGTISGSILPALSGVFPDDVIANSDQDDNTLGKWPISLTNWGNASLFGPAVRLGRIDKAYSWALVADTFAGGTPGTVPRFRLVSIGESATYRYALQVSEDEVTPVAGAYYLTPSPTGALNLGAPSSSGFGANARIGTAWLSSGVSERSRTYLQGTRQAYSYSSGDFTADTGTWTVDSGDVSGTAKGIEWTKIGLRMAIDLMIATTSTSGTPNYLKFALPGSSTVDGDVVVPCAVFVGGVWQTGSIQAVSGETCLRILSTLAGGGWPNETNTIWVRGQVGLFVTS